MCFRFLKLEYSLSDLYESLNNKCPAELLPVILKKIYISKGDTDLWQTLLPLLAKSWHVYTPTATHMDPQTHTYAVKVWKWLCMIREQPKALRGINNRPNPETTNTISRLQKDVGVMFVNECACGGYWMICMCIYIFSRVCLDDYVCFSAFTFALVCVIEFFARVFVSVNNEPHTSSIP